MDDLIISTRSNWIGVHKLLLGISIGLLIPFVALLIIGLVLMFKDFKNQPKKHQIIKLSSVITILLANLVFHTVIIIPYKKNYQFKKDCQNVCLSTPRADLIVIFPLETYSIDENGIRFTIANKYSDSFAFTFNDKENYQGQEYDAYIINKNENADSILYFIKLSENEYIYTYSHTTVTYNDKNYYIFTPFLSTEALHDNDTLNDNDFNLLNTLGINRNLYEYDNEHFEFSQVNYHYSLDDNTKKFTVEEGTF